MDTEQKKRKGGIKPPAGAGKPQPPKRRPAPAAEEAAQEKKGAARQQTPPKRRPAAAQPAEQERRNVPRAGEAKRRPAPQQKPAERRAAAPGEKLSPPKGTGPRKSAPQMTPQQQRAARAARKTDAANRTVKQNALQNFISGVKGEEKKEGSLVDKANARQNDRANRAAHRRRQAERYDTPALIYTQPQAFNRNRLLIQLLTVTAVVVALVMGMSVFFKVEKITVSGTETYSEWSVREASGIAQGDNLLTFSKARASAQIRAKLAYVDKVRIGIKLPDTVNIYIEEEDVTYAIKSSDGDYWLMTSDGRIVEHVNSAGAKNHTEIIGVTLESPAVNTTAIAVENVPTETNEAGEFIPVAVTGAQRLSSVMQILKAMEANDIVGEAASVDVTRIEDIILWYGSRYQVMLGDTARMEYKIACMNDAILQMSDYQSGILDISFNTWTDQVGYTPFQ